MSRKNKRNLLRIIISAVLIITAFLLDKFLINNFIIELVLYLVPYFIIGYDVLLRAFRNILIGQVFDENFLMTVATIGAICIGFFPNTEKQYSEAVFVMLFYQTGELFQSIAVGKSRRSISSLMEIRPDVARIERDGIIEEVSAEEISVGDVITVRPGDRIALDGVVITGESALDTVALTGESVPRTVRIGDSILSGCVNLSQVLKIKVTKPFEESTVSRILELVENSSANKSKSENFITRFARYYTPAVCFAALLLAFLPPFFASVGYISSLPVWLIRALTFLVVSCPCALVISVPLSFFGGIGGASKKGILIKGSNYLEALSLTKTVVLDKTDTLTQGSFEVTEVLSTNLSENELLKYAATAEIYSNHPIAEALKRAYQGNINPSSVLNITELAGLGITAEVDSKKVACGNQRLMKQLGFEVDEPNSLGTVIHIAIDEKYEGAVVISDKLKSSSKEAIQSLRKAGVKRISMLTGDRLNVAEKIAKQLEIDEFYSELLPEDKVKKVEEMLTNTEKGKKLMFVGDGINDAPVLMRADIGCAMGGLGSDAAIEAADIVIMDDDLLKISTAISIARRTALIVRQNIGLALGVKALVLLLSIFGYAPMWAAVFADVGVAIIAILNSMRTLK
ncbi:MAG: cadmium-translocating P-type ATPase [Clostridia bacterium]|nr:cadmium-translocating P-type ATPase [Clostridia bacterium]